MVLVLVNVSCFAKQDSFKDMLIVDDFNTWVDGGSYFLNWKKITNFSIEKAVNTQDIKNDYSSNEIAANRKYVNQWIRIQGIVNNTKIDKNGEMYTDLTQNYINFKAYISDENYAASLMPQQKVDMYCFNPTEETTSHCIDYKKLIWSKIPKETILNIENNSGIDLLVSAITTNESIHKNCFENISSIACKNSLNNKKDIQNTLMAIFKNACGESKDSEKCINLKKSGKDLQELIK